MAGSIFRVRTGGRHALPERSLVEEDSRRGRLRRPPRRLRRALPRNRRAPVCPGAVNVTRSEGPRVRASGAGRRPTSRSARGRPWVDRPPCCCRPERPGDAAGAARRPRGARHRRAYGTGASVDRAVPGVRSGGRPPWRGRTLPDAPLLHRSSCPRSCISCEKKPGSSCPAVMRALTIKLDRGCRTRPPPGRRPGGARTRAAAEVLRDTSALNDEIAR